MLRIVVGFLFIQGGTQKLFGVPHGPTTRAALTWLSQPGLAGFLETFGGLAILLGLFTRPVAFLLCGEMAVAYFQVHAPKGFFPAVNGGQNAVLFCFIFLYFSISGGGDWSLDRWLTRLRKPPK